jgi:hypothetical protein
MEHEQSNETAIPLQPDVPALYIGLAPSDKRRQYFEKMGWDMSGRVPVKKLPNTQEDERDSHDD